MHLLKTRRFAPLFWTQLLGAFNDNLFKSALVVTLTFGTLRSGALSTDALVNLSTALLMLPFFLFSALAGQLADRFDKAVLVRVLKITELVVMLVALVGFQLSSLPMLMTALFAMGTQSAFFGPVKYGILPQHLPEHELVSGNGLVEMGTFVAILGGTIAGALIVALPGVGIGLIGAALVGVSVLGIVTSRWVPDAAPLHDAKIDLNPVRATRDTLRIGRRDPKIWLAILGASWFWAVGAFVLGQMPHLAANLGGDERALTWMLSAFSIGIGIGSVACEKLSRGRIEVGMVPLAGVAMAVALVGLGQAQTVATACLALGLLGAFGGLFIVPLYALMQHRAQEDERSRVIAANNIVNAAFMVGAAIYATLRLSMGMDVSALVIEVAVIHLIITTVALVIAYQQVVRLMIERVVRMVYRVRVDGLDEHLPDEGPALVVANHLSFVDAAVVGGLCKRPVRFVMDHRMAKMFGMQWFFRLVRVIPIASYKEDPELLERAFAEIDAALANGEIVGIFPEGKCTRDGELNVFKPGVEKILAKRPVPVVPVAIEGLWGGFFSYAHGTPMSSWPRRFLTRIRVTAGQPLPATARASQMHQTIAELLNDQPGR